MNANDTNIGGRFFGRLASVYAVCGLLAVPALARPFDAPQNQPDKPKAAAPPRANGAKDDGKDVKVTEYGSVDISVQDTDLAVVLQMLAIESKKNIIAAKGVSATVTANLYDVTFYEALKAILDVNGFTYYEEGNFIYVVTKEEMQAMEKARKRTESRVFELQHLSAADAREFTLPLLSDVGKASARGEVTPGMKPDISNAGADDYAFSAKLVINDYSENLQAIAGLLANVDTPPQQVLVEATILQTTLDETNAFGVDFTVLGSMNFTDLTSPLAAINNLIAGGDPTSGFQPPDNTAGGASTNVGGTAGSAGLKVGIVSDDIAVFLRVLDEVTDTTVLARPKVMALNHQRAQVLVGARVGYLSTTATETTTTQSVEFLDTGIELVFRPFISPDGMIRMELSPSVSEASLRSVTDANGQIVTIPDELTNEMTTNVRIKDGQTLVLGGLFKESTRVTRRQVPLLGDLPLLGTAFRGQDDKVTRNEIIFLITPTIVHDQTLWAAGQSSLNAVDSLRVGARSSLLPFSKDKITANYNQNASDAFARGDNDKAMYYINNSLNAYPNQPEMIRLREKINGEKARNHERSMMEQVFRKEMGATTQPGAAPKAMGNTDSSTQTTSADGSDSMSSSDDLSMSDASSSDDMASSDTSDSMSMDDSSSETQTTSVDTDESNPQSETESSTTENTVSVDTENPTPNSTASRSNSSATDRQGYEQQFLHDFFIAVGLPSFAVQYASSDDENFSDTFPFVTFDDIAGATTTSKSPD